MISLRADRRDIAAGARAMVPWLAGIVPFGLVIGVSAAQADVPALAGWLTGPLIYAGSAQVATIGMLSAGAAPMAVVAVALVINVRLIFYSATMARHWRGTPWWWRLAAAYLLVDPSVAVGLDGYRRLGRGRGHAHYLGGAVLLWVSWLAAIGAGATAGAGLPAWLHLEFVIPLYLVGQAIAKLADPAPRRAIFAAAAVALLALSAPLQLGIALAIAAGIAAGLTARPAGPRSHPPASAIHGGTAMNAWIVILAAGLGSYLFRLSMIVLFDRITMPAYLQRASGLVAPAAFAALAAAGVATACRGLGVARAAAPLAAVAVAVIAVLRTGSPQAAILAGMPALWVATALLPT